MNFFKQKTNDSDLANYVETSLNARKMKLNDMKFETQKEIDGLKVNFNIALNKHKNTLLEINDELAMIERALTRISTDPEFE